MSASEARRATKNCMIGDYTFEGVASFMYLGTDLNNTDQPLEEINKIVTAGSRVYRAKQIITS